MVNHRHLTAALIDSRDFLSAKRRSETEVMLPQGTKIALTGGTDFNDHRLIWGKLDQVQTKYPDMILLHGGSPKGAELIAAKWAEARKVTQVAFKPDWTYPSGEGRSDVRSCGRVSWRSSQEGFRHRTG